MATQAWVDATVMKQIANKFVTHKNKVHGRGDDWVLLFCDNLKAHSDEADQKIFGDNKVLLCFLPPNMTNFIKPIYAGIGRSVHTAIDHQLDDKLMHEKHMEIWEGKMSAGDCRILMTEFDSRAMNKVMGTDYEKSQISAFERTGCLITWLVNEEHYNRIRQ